MTNTIKVMLLKNDIRALSKSLSLFLRPLAFCLLCLMTPLIQAQTEQSFTGTWVFNESLSDNTDRQVEKALRAAGEPVRRTWFRKTQDKYRGGPPEQELYDHISYDRILTIILDEPEFQFTYEDDFLRPVYTDNRSQSVSLNSLEEVKDFSFAHWEGSVLEVEARPRDGGFANESYTLINNGTQLRVEMHIEPKSFREPIEIVRVYDRQIITND